VYPGVYATLDTPWGVPWCICLSYTRFTGGHAESPLPTPVSLLGMLRGPSLLLSRFTVGHAKRALLPPFHCWAEKEARKEGYTYPGTPLGYLPGIYASLPALFVGVPPRLPSHARLTVTHAGRYVHVSVWRICTFDREGEGGWVPSSPIREEAKRGEYARKREIPPV